LQSPEPVSCSSSIALLLSPEEDALARKLTERQKKAAQDAKNAADQGMET